MSGAADLVAGPADGVAAVTGVDGSVVLDGATGGTDGSLGPNDGAVQPMPDATFDAMDASPPRPDGGRFVFVTSGETTGDLAGVAGADTRCATVATKAGLGGAWMAWVSTMASSAPSRLTSAGPWYLVTGELVASSKMELSGFGNIEHAIDHDEKGVMRASSAVWTGGAYGFLSCGDWATSAASGSGGTTGSTQLATPAWQESSAASCDTTHSLYCFEN